MNAPDIFGPRPSRQMRQPKKDVLREQLVLAADEIIRLREASQTVAPHMKKRQPWWLRAFRRAA
jgi:hypothetical protein